MMVSFRQADILETFRYHKKQDATVQYAFVFEKIWQNEDGSVVLKKDDEGGLQAWCSIEIGHIPKKEIWSVDDELRARVSSKLRKISDADPLRFGPKVNAKRDMDFDDFKEYIIGFYKPKFQDISQTPVEQKFSDQGGSFWLMFNFTVKIL